MKKIKSLSIIRTMTIGILWSIVYIPIFSWISEQLFGRAPFVISYLYSPLEGLTIFSPFSDWAELYRAFNYGQWVVNDFASVSLVAFFLLYFPLWAYGWYRCVKRKWTSISLSGFMRSSFANDSKKMVIKVKKTCSDRPRALRNRPVMLGSLPPVSAQGPDTAPPPVAMSPTLDASQIVSADVKQQIKEWATAVGFEVFENVALDGYLIPMVVASDTRALLVRFLNTEGAEWVAEETTSDSNAEPMWFSATGQEESPFYYLEQAQKILQAKEPASVIKMLVVVLQGALLNPETVLPMFENNGGKMVALEGLADVLAQERQADKAISEEPSVS